MRYKSREEKLKDAIELELNKPEPTINNMVNIVNKYETVNLKTIEKLKKTKRIYTNGISGALKQVINAHGPITKNLLGSATKRIYGSLISVERDKITKIKIKYYFIGILTCICVRLLLSLLK
jgi:hypothetical protein